MKNTMMKLVATMLIPAALLVFTSCSTTPRSQTAAPEAARGSVVVDTATAIANVQSVNANTRTVVLQRPDGSLVTYECGPEVINFDQIRVGDQVTAQVVESVAVGLIKGGVPPGAGTASVVLRAPLGENPAGRMVDTSGFTSKVVSVDKKNRDSDIADGRRFDQDGKSWSGRQTVRSKAR